MGQSFNISLIIQSCHLFHQQKYYRWEQMGKKKFFSNVNWMGDVNTEYETKYATSENMKNTGGAHGLSARVWGLKV